MRRKFFVLLDFSKGFETIIDFSAELASKSDNELHIVHQVPLLVPAMADNKGREQIIQAEKDDAVIKLKSLLRNIPDYSVRKYYHVTDRNIVLHLFEDLKPTPNDIVVVGIKKMSLLQKWLMGTTITKVIEYLTCPLIALPLGLKVYLPKTLLISSSIKYPINKPALRSMTQILHVAGAEKMFFTSVLEDDAEDAITPDYLEGLAAQFKDEISTDKEVYKGTNLLETLKSKADEHHQPIIVLQRGSRSLTDQLFRDFVIDELVHDAQTPLIVLP